MARGERTRRNVIRCRRRKKREGSGWEERKEDAVSFAGYLLPSRPEGSLSMTLNDDRPSLFDPKRPSTIAFAPKGRPVQDFLLMSDANLRDTIILIEFFRLSVPHVTLDSIGRNVLFSLENFASPTL